MNSVFKMVWWNTGLSPPTAKKTKGKRTLSEVLNILSQMHKDNTRIFGLCEISSDDVNNPEFDLFLTDHDLVYKSFFDQDGKVIWDIILIYQPSVFSLIDYSYCQAKKSAKHKKLAILVEGEIFNTKVRIFLSHFPTLNRESDPVLVKGNMYTELYYRMIDDTDYEPNTIAMGDYNIELCSSDIFNNISRSRKGALDNDQLYSPFTRHIGEKYHTNEIKEISGTMFYKKKWLFCDFITLTSGFFYTNSKLVLDDFKTGIWDDFFNNNEIRKDHLPIFITIEKGE